MGDRPEQLSDGTSYLSTYQTFGNPIALDRAVAEYRSALTKHVSKSEARVLAQIGLSNALRLQLEDGLEGQRDEEELYGEASSLAEAAVQDAVPGSDLQLSSLRALGEVLLHRGHNCHDPQGASDTFRELVQLASSSRSQQLTQALGLYAMALCRQFDWSSTDSEQLTLANQAVDRAIRLIAEGEDIPDELREAHAMVRAARGSVTFELNDIDEAISVIQGLIDRVTLGHRRLGVYYNSLSFNYYNRYIVSGAPEDLDREIVASDESRKRIPQSHPLWHQAQGKHADALYRRFLARGDLKDQQEAITVARGGVQHFLSTLPGKALHGDVFLLKFAEMLTERYSHTGSPELLDEVVTLHWTNLKRSPMPRRAQNLRTIASAHRSRFVAYGRLADLERAVSVLDEASECPASALEHTRVIHDLSDALIALHKERKDVCHLDRAIFLIRTFLASDWPQPQERGRHHSVLGLALLMRSRITLSLEDVQESIECQQLTLTLIPNQCSEQHVCYFRLGLAEFQSFTIGQQSMGVANSILAFNRALAVLPLDHTAKASYLSHLSKSLLTLYDLEGSTTAVEEALQTLQEAATHPTSWPVDRYMAANDWARFSHQNGYLSSAIEGYRLAVSLLPQVASIGLEDELRVQHIGKWAKDLPQDAAACAVELGELELAFELLEAGRTVLWNSGQELKADLARLEQVAPHLAQELAETNAALRFRPHAEGEAMSNPEREFERRRRHRLAFQRNELLSRIRLYPGFEHFLSPPTFSSLRRVAVNGPIVVLNASPYRCDALVIHPNEDITNIPLIDIHYEQIKKEAMILQRCLGSTRDKRGLHFLDVVLRGLLRRLWVSIGRPVSVTLQNYLAQSPSPRVWWCPTGILSFLPIHACGPLDSTRQGIVDRVVSSYTPTITALLRAQKERSTGYMTSPSMLVVCQPNAPGYPPLPDAIHELSVLRTLFSESGTFLVGPAATVSTVETELQHHPWVHVTSHGTQNSINPFESAVALYDGPLKLSRLAETHLPCAEMAFLSACHSAKGTESIPDESMHLAAGLMFAGFRGVVATSWGIADKDGPHVARVFYTYLTRKGSAPLATDAAEALHKAVQYLRNSGVGAHRWVPFIHLGA